MTKANETPSVDLNIDDKIEAVSAMLADELEEMIAEDEMFSDGLPLEMRKNLVELIHRRFCYFYCRGRDEALRNHAELIADVLEEQERALQAGSELVQFLSTYGENAFQAGTRAAALQEVCGRLVRCHHNALTCIAERLKREGDGSGVT